MPRSKEKINLLTVGNLFDSAHTISEVIATVLAMEGLAPKKDYAYLNQFVNQQEGGVLIKKTEVVYETATGSKQVTHITCASEMDCIKQLLAGNKQINGVILATPFWEDNVLDGEIIKTMKWCNQMKIVPIVFIDLDRRGGEDYGIETFEAHIRENIGVDIQIVCGSPTLALKGDDDGLRAIRELYDSIDRNFLPSKPEEEPFFMPIKGVRSITGRGTVVDGRIEKGRIRFGESVSLNYPSDERSDRYTTVNGVEKNGEIGDEGKVGEEVGLILRGISRNEVVDKSLLCNFGRAYSAMKKVKILMYTLSKAEGNQLNNTVVNGTVVDLFYGFPKSVKGIIEIITEFTDRLREGGKAIIMIEVEASDLIFAYQNKKITIKKDNQLIGVGRIVFNG